MQSSGTTGFDPTRPSVMDGELNVTGAGIVPGRLLTKNIGTSFAAPFVSRVALAILGRYPEFSANLVRALILLGAERPWDGAEIDADSEAKRVSALRRLIGFGSTSIVGALGVDDHRAILVAEAEIDMDAVHIYELPVPSSYFESGGSRTLDVAVTHDPPTKVQRLDYLGNKLEFYVVKGMSTDQVAETFAKMEFDDEPDGAASDGDESETDQTTENSGSKESPKISALGSKQIKMNIPVKVLSLGCNQRASRTFTQRVLESEAPWHIVIRSVNRWCDDTAKQDYALAVSLRRDPNQKEILAELAAQLQAIVEVRIEGEAETEIEL